MTQEAVQQRLLQLGSEQAQKKEGRRRKQDLSQAINHEFEQKRLKHDEKQLHPEETQERNLLQESPFVEQQPEKQETQLQPSIEGKQSCDDGKIFCGYCNVHVLKKNIQRHNSEHIVCQVCRKVGLRKLHRNCNGFQNEEWSYIPVLAKKLKGLQSVPQRGYVPLLLLPDPPKSNNQLFEIIEAGTKFLTTADVLKCDETIDKLDEGFFGVAEPKNSDNFVKIQEQNDVIMDTSEQAPIVEVVQMPLPPDVPLGKFLTEIGYQIWYNCEQADQYQVCNACQLKHLDGSHRHSCYINGYSWLQKVETFFVIAMQEACKRTKVYWHSSSALEQRNFVVKTLLQRNEAFFFEAYYNGSGALLKVPEVHYVNMETGTVIEETDNFSTVRKQAENALKNVPSSSNMCVEASQFYNTSACQQGTLDAHFVRTSLPSKTPNEVDQLQERMSKAQLNTENEISFDYAVHILRKPNKAAILHKQFKNSSTEHQAALVVVTKALVDQCLKLASEVCYGCQQGGLKEDLYHKSGGCKSSAAVLCNGHFDEAVKGLKLINLPKVDLDLLRCLTKEHLESKQHQLQKNSFFNLEHNR